MNAIEDLDNVFSLLHDSWISALQGDFDKLTMEVQCEYLAELVDASFDRFYLQLVGIDKFEFHPWWKEDAVENKAITVITEIASLELGICSAEIREDFVNVYCDTDNSNAYTGGNLFLRCSKIILFDQNRNEMTIDGLTEICKGYWDNFGKKRSIEG